MSKKKSLGSSPIEVKPKQNTSMSFIPDLGRGGRESENNHQSKKKQSSSRRKESTKKKKANTSKKVVSYSLETDLIEEIKEVASENDMYYSSLVSKVLKKWLIEQK